MKGLECVMGQCLMILANHFQMMFLEHFSLGLEFENKLIELCGETKNTLALNPLGKNVKLLQSMTSATDEGNLVGLGHTNTDNIDGEPLKYSK